SSGRRCRVALSIKASRSGSRRRVSPAIANASARSGGDKFRATERAPSSVWPRRSTASSICSAAWRAPAPSTLGIGGPDHHLEIMKRPKHLKPPAHVSPSPPLPEPESVEAPDAPAGEDTRPDPTRYGYWENNGIAVEFY